VPIRASLYNVGLQPQTAVPLTCCVIRTMTISDWGFLHKAQPGSIQHLGDRY
jgi:hypothetical protein